MLNNMEKLDSEDYERDLWTQLSRHRGLVGGTLVEYQRGTEVARDTICGSRIVVGVPPAITIIGKSGEKVSLGMDTRCSKIKKVDGRYEILCQPEFLDTYEVAVAPKGVEIPEGDK
jgi:hypothetical protein